jgi:hypothetical protein
MINMQDRPATASPKHQRNARNSQCIDFAFGPWPLGFMTSDEGGLDGMARFYWKPQKVEKNPAGHLIHSEGLSDSGVLLSIKSKFLI